MVTNTKQYMNEYREKNRERLKGINQKWRKENKEQIKRKQAEDYQKHKEEIKRKNNDYYHKNKHNPIFKLKRNEYYPQNRERINKQSLQRYYRYKKENPEKIRARDIANKKLKHLRPKGYEFHHPDYSKPLLVEVLPIAEHKALHAQINKQEKML